MDHTELARQRVLAWLIDLAIVFGLLLLLLRGLGWWVGGAYVLFRDGFFEGQSLGKRILGLRVVVHQDQMRCTFFESVLRNLLWLLPGVNIIVGFTGLHALAHDPRGRHWGDRLANSQVIAVGGE